MRSESITQAQISSLQTEITVRTSRRSRKRKFMNSLKRKHITEKNKLEEIRRLLIHNSFIGNYLHDKLHMNVHNITKVTNNCTTMSATFEHK